MRTCSACNETKSLDLFARDKRRHDGIGLQCKACVKAKQDIRVARFKVNRPGRHLEVVREWQKRNREYVNSVCRERKAVRRRATPPWADRKAIKENYDLARARTKATGFKWEVDHIIPLVHPLVCGLHYPGNLWVMPAIYNRRKGNKLLPTDRLGIITNG